MGKYGIISHLLPTSPITESYRKIRTNLDFLSIDDALQVINVTSTGPEEGKTITLLNLATVYAQNGKKVVIIDLDLRKPKIHHAFKSRNLVGVTDYLLKDDLAMSKIIHHTNINVDVIYAGSKKSPYSAELLGTQKLQELLEHLKKKYDYILIDCPPVGAVADPVIISTFSDGTIFVVAARKTHKHTAKNYYKLLDNDKINVLGAVVTMVKEKELGYYGYYATEYMD